MRSSIVYADMIHATRQSLYGEVAGLSVVEDITISVLRRGIQCQHEYLTGLIDLLSGTE